MTGDSTVRRARHGLTSLFVDHARIRRGQNLLIAALLLLNLTLLGGVMYFASGVKLRLYVVEVDRFGTPLKVQSLEPEPEPHESFLRYQIGLWIKSAREIYSDAEATNAFLRSAFSYCSAEASRKLRAAFEDPEADPRKLYRSLTRSVDVTSLLRLSDDVWQVSWEETSITKTGERQVEPWQALLTVALEPPTSAEERFHNPLGLVVDDFSWNPVRTGE